MLGRVLHCLWLVACLPAWEDEVFSIHVHEPPAAHTQLSSRAEVIYGCGCGSPGAFMLSQTGLFVLRALISGWAGGLCFLKFLKLP